MTWTRVEFSFIGRGLFTLDSTHSDRVFNSVALNPVRCLILLKGLV